METINTILSCLAIFAVIYGWYRVNSLTKERDSINQQVKRLESIVEDRRKVEVDYLMEAFADLAFCCQRPNDWIYEQGNSERIELAIAKIQLVGTVDEVNLVLQFMGAIESNKSANIDGILNNLRDRLRVSLKIPPISQPIKHLRFKNPKG